MHKRSIRLALPLLLAGVVLFLTVAAVQPPEYFELYAVRSGQLEINILPPVTEALSLTSTPTITTTILNSSANSLSGQTEWNDTCVSQRMEISGLGMGDETAPLNPQTLSLANPAEVNWLLAQVAGRYSNNAPTPDKVTITTSAPESLTLSEPSSTFIGGYTFETSLQPTHQITALVNNPGNNYKTPRGLILYAKRGTGTEQWTSVGKITNTFVYHDSYSETLTFQALTQTTDLSITAVVIDNQVDDRPLILEAAAGGVVTQSIPITRPSDGPLLNIVHLTLAQVPTGTGQAEITLKSPSKNGDSLVWVGVNVSYRCVDAPDKPTLIYLPIIYKNYEPTICSLYGPTDLLLTNRATLTAQPIINYANRYTIEVKVPANSNIEYGLTFGHATDPTKYYRFGIIHTRNGIPARFRLKWQYGRKSTESICITENSLADYCGFGDDTINISSNHLKVECGLNTIKLYLNNKPAPVWQSDKYSCRGGIGIFLEAPSQQITGSFSDFQISCPSDVSPLNIAAINLPPTLTMGPDSDLDD